MDDILVIGLRTTELKELKNPVLKGLEVVRPCRSGHFCVTILPMPSLFPRYLRLLLSLSISAALLICANHCFLESAAADWESESHCCPNEVPEHPHETLCDAGMSLQSKSVTDSISGFAPLMFVATRITAALAEPEAEMNSRASLLASFRPPVPVRFCDRIVLLLAAPNAPPFLLA